MTIEYALTRSEVLRGFLSSLRTSPKYRVTIFAYDLGAGLVGLIFSGALSKPIGIATALAFLGGMLGFMLLLIFMLVVRAKTSTRSLTISNDGLSTQIGTLTGNVAWEKVHVVEDGGSFVLIGRTNGNAFFIPNRAFTNDESKSAFVDRARTWSRTH